jgi:hypothetical protein
VSDLLASGLLILAVAVSTAATGDPFPEFKITTKRKDDSLEVRADKDKPLFTVKCPSGINQASRSYNPVRSQLQTHGSAGRGAARRRNAEGIAPDVLAPGRP